MKPGKHRDLGPLRVSRARLEVSGSRTRPTLTGGA